MTLLSLLRGRIPESSKRLLRSYSASSRMARRISPYLSELVCVDVGASYYPHAKWKILLESPRTQWLAVEPNEQNLDYVRQWQWPCHVTPVPVGLSRHGGKQTLHITNVDSGSSLLPPVITPGMELRITKRDYFFPVRTKLIDTLTLAEVVARAASSAPVFVKLDTQGTELSILQGAEALLRSRRVVGIEMEATLLAEPVMQGAGKLWEACRYLEDLGFEMMRIDPIYGLSRLGHQRPKGRTFLNECDSVFALRPDVASALAPEYRLARMAFALTNAFYEEALSVLEHDADVVALLGRNGCDTAGLAAYLRSVA